jgi:hypothetical protein
LAALARTHTSYHKEAERALYKNLSIYNTSDDSLKCMETLATNSEKAALVRFLTVEYAPLYLRDNIQVDNIVKNLKVTTYLSKSLINMHCLSDFRVKLNHDEAEVEMINGLGKILWSVLKILIFSELTVLLVTSQGHFRLQTLYCHNFFDLSQIITRQTELQILGLYSPSNPGNILKTLKELHDAQLFLPIIVTFERESLTTLIDRISIFPAFCSVDRRATIPLLLVQSFCKDQDNDTFPIANYVHELFTWFVGHRSAWQIRVLSLFYIFLFIYFTSAKLVVIMICFQNKS